MQWSVHAAQLAHCTHHIRLRRLDSSYQIVGTLVYHWFQSYLSNRLQHVLVGSSSSSPCFMVWSVPQGSVLGALLFLLYCCDLQLIIESHGLSPHLYADDSQIYGSCRPSPGVADAHLNVHWRCRWVDALKSFSVKFHEDRDSKFGRLQVIDFISCHRLRFELAPTSWRSPLLFETLEFFSTLTCRWGLMSRRWCRHASLRWDSSYPFAVHYPDPSFRHWWRHLSSVVWTTATRHWPVFFNIFFDGSSQLWMQLLDWSTRRRSLNISLHSSVNFTGWRQRRELISNSQFLCSNVSMGLRRHTSLINSSWFSSSM